ncbi:hypothetical protein [Rubellimicrobium sp. CFH 75288]|uniref:hypothetical protein n=1 Tax=Rubellimicrobium sp. CFH 75288 TaxID=2697034 RepID=UPI001412CA7B|nr:hypothetical protein [Rubellimicrobium sp. CFH 75288]NAZ38160.1 hypothetical protein [Rubellimicrobium sp. CFH 75288]
MSFDPMAELARVLAAEAADPALDHRAIRANDAISALPEADRIARIARIARAPDVRPESAGHEDRAAGTGMYAASSDARDAFEERAAIREFDGGQAQAEAERAALGEVAAAFGIAPEQLA